MPVIKLQRRNIATLVGATSGNYMIHYHNIDGGIIQIHKIGGDYKGEVNIANCTNKEIKNFLSVWGFEILFIEIIEINTMKDLIQFLGNYYLELGGCGFVSEDKTEEYTVEQLEEKYKVKINF